MKLEDINWFGFEWSAFLMVFIVLNVVNVLIQTIKSVVTIKGGKWSAAITNAVAYGLYTVVVVFMSMKDLGLLWKAVIIGVANLLGVYVVKLFEEKGRKDKLWKVETTVNKNYTMALDFHLTANKISHNCIKGVGDYTVFNCFCVTQQESKAVKELLSQYNAKYFVSESKTL